MTPDRDRRPEAEADPHVVGSVGEAPTEEEAAPPMPLGEPAGGPGQQLQVGEG